LRAMHDRLRPFALATSLGTPPSLTSLAYSLALVPRKAPMIDRCENDRRKALRDQRGRSARRSEAVRLKQSETQERVNARRRADPEKRKADSARVRARALMRQYGITAEQYDKMLARQGGKCAMCGRPPKKIRLAVEHDHKTKRVRGLTCYRCNHFFIGQNTAETARFLVWYLSSNFDGRAL